MENMEFEKIDNEFEYASKSLQHIIDVITKEYVKMQIAYEKSKQFHLQEKLELKNKILELQYELIDIYSANPIIDVEVE
jgi:uncharacterized protein YPO0396